MTSQFSSRLYTARVPAWKNLTNISNEEKEQGAVETLEELGDFYVEKRPLTIDLNGSRQETGGYAIVRSPVKGDMRESVFGYTEERYKPLQPFDIATLFDENIGLPVDSVGLLQEGKKMFISWGLEPINVNGDEVNTYGFLAAGFDGMFGASLSTIFLRVVCTNMWNRIMRQASSLKKRNDKALGKLWSGKHTSHNLARDMGIWLSHVQELSIKRSNSMALVFNEMAKQKIESNGQLADMLFAIVPNPESVPDDFPERLRSEKEAKYMVELERSNTMRTDIETLYSGAGTKIDATSWGLFNAVSEYANYGMHSKKDPSNSVLFGARGKLMDKTMDIIVEKIGVKYE